jgi:hypothetical protein
LFAFFQSGFPRELFETFSTRLTAFETQFSAQQADLQNRLSAGFSDLRNQFGELEGRVLAQRRECEASASELTLSVTMIQAAQRELQYLRSRSLGLTESAPMDGIIAELTRIHAGNVCTKGIVGISASSESRDARFLADFTCDTRWISKEEARPWICWDFRDLLVRLDGYSLKYDGWSMPQSWMIEGSLDGVKWKEIGRRKVTHGSTGEGSVHPFSIPKTSQLRFMRMTQLGVNSDGRRELRLAGWSSSGRRLHTQVLGFATHGQEWSSTVQ